MRIAVVGAGVSGLVAARLLHRKHEIDVFEAGPYAGGHSNTVEARVGGVTLPVDTGFIVFNERTYPLFCRLLKGLGVAWKDSDMSFSARIERSGMEYCGDGFGGLFAQRRNLLRIGHWRMVRDILRFYREARAVLDEGEADGSGDMGGGTLGEYLRKHRYSRAFIDDHLVPMAAAVWSADPVGILDFPVRTFVRFFANHGFLEVDDRPQWLTVVGGSREYVRVLIEPFRERVHLSTPVRAVRRTPDGPRLTLRDGREVDYDAVVMATHSDTALHLLADADDDERAIVGAVPYQRNTAVLHTDARLLPRTRATWSSWNYHVPDQPTRVATLTYWMNRLQGLETPEPLLVSLNRDDEIDPARVLARMEYDHPVFTVAAVRAQQRRAEIQGRNNTWWCGAWWGYGFHEDGARSGVEVGEALGESLDQALAAPMQPQGATA